ncbi:unnamed protein product [Rhizophagus irregularis]|nr:unnamed protein product [Rhizophagus irregularis]
MIRRIIHQNYVAYLKLVVKSYSKYLKEIQRMVFKMIKKEKSFVLPHALKQREKKVKKAKKNEIITFMVCKIS